MLVNHAGKNLIDEILDSPTGIAKCKRRLQFFRNKLKDENKPRKTKKRKLITNAIVRDILYYFCGM